MLVDTSVWIDHLRRGNARLSELLEHGSAWCHPFVVGELACGNLSNRSEILWLLEELPRGVVADHEEVLALVESRRLMARGIGWIDAHLLASALLSLLPLWTLDRRLASIAASLNVAAEAR